MKSTFALSLLAITSSVVAQSPNVYESTMTPAEFSTLKTEIVKLLDAGHGPLFVRLAWHDAGTYDKADKTGGPHGSMRFAPVSGHGANNGLDVARNLLEPLKASLKEKITYADLWSFAGAVAVAHADGPAIKWRPGRADVPDPNAENAVAATPADRLPGADKGPEHSRTIFGRMDDSFANDEAVVALMGGHQLGSVHSDVSGQASRTLPWTATPLKFSNLLYVDLMNQEWTRHNFTKTDGSETWEFLNNADPAKATQIMLPADYDMRTDPGFKVATEKFAADKKVFFDSFAKHYTTLLELGVDLSKSKEVDVCVDGKECSKATTDGKDTKITKSSATALVAGSLISGLSAAVALF